MPALTRIGDPLNGHGCFPNHNIAEGSSDVIVNNIPASREGDSSTVHCCGSCHTGVMTGSNTVFINGRSAQKVGDPVSCGSSQAGGSPDVFIG